MKLEGQIINGFELKHLLGKGGMAEVWYAENEIGKPSAVKILNEDLSHNAQIVERFRNEAVVMVKLDHPYIRQVYGYGTIDEHPCIIMEYLDGDDLKARMKQGQRFSAADLEKWWNQLADALNYTHAEGIVHRDIKPSNIFLDKKGNIKLLDFGIAKIRESISMTQTGAMMGTLMYMSPEQVEDSKHIGPESDNYSLAVSFVHLLTGIAPYDSTTSSDFKIRESIVYKPLDLSGVPAEWQGFLAPYLAKKPEDRPALRTFERLASETPIQPIDDEGTFVNDAPKKQEYPRQEWERPQSNPTPKQESNKPKSKMWLWIALAALLVGVISFVLVNNKKKNDRIQEEMNARRMEENCFNNCLSIADYQDYLNRYPDGMYVSQASTKMEQLRKESMESSIRSFINEYTMLAETSDTQLIYRLVSKIYAPSVKRYFSAYDVSSDYVADCYNKYDETFGVYGKHSSVRWNTVSFTESNGTIQLTYVEDFSIDRYDPSKYSIFVLEKHFELNRDFKVVSVYDVQLSKSKK